VISAVRNTIRLYREEPIPVGKPLPHAKPLDARLRSAPAR
jgi:hypothetical protein